MNNAQQSFKMSSKLRAAIFASILANVMMVFFITSWAPHHGNNASDGIASQPIFEQVISVTQLA